MKFQSPVVSQERLQDELLCLWKRLLDTSDLSIDDDFFDAGGDSLLATEMMVELRRLAAKDIPGTLLFEASTIRTLVTRVEEAQDVRPTAAVRVSAVASAETPLLFFHGDWTGGGFYVRHLARKLEPELPLIAITPHGADDEPIPGSIEAMAADRLTVIKEVQPRGPYRLGGHCIGAIVALETARLLAAEGHQIEAVAMIDPPLTPPDSVWTQPAITPSKEGSVGRGQEVATEAGDTVFVPDATASPEKWRRYNEALSAYVPTPLRVPLTLFVSTFDGRPWCRLSHDSKLCKTRGDHFVWVSGQAGGFAEKLKRRIGPRNLNWLTPWRRLRV